MSYLSNRTQNVYFKESMSDECRIVYGVPQGSILGPILFLLYINDLPQFIPSADITLYADDTSLGNAAPSADLSLHVNNRLKVQAGDWFCANRLCLNNDKTVTMQFSLKRDKYCPPVTTKYLGLFIDSELRWTKHGDYVATKISKGIYLLRNLSNNLSSKYIRIAYFSLLHCHFDHGILNWGHSTSLQRLFKLQRRAVRIVAGIGYRDECKPHFTKLKIFTLPCLFIFRCLEHLIKNFGNYFPLKSFHQYETRTDEIAFKLLRLSKSKSGTSYYAIKFFNKLPNSFKKMTPKLFLMKIKQHLLDHAYYSFEEYLHNNLFEI